MTSQLTVERTQRYPSDQSIDSLNGHEVRVGDGNDVLSKMPVSQVGAAVDQLEGVVLDLVGEDAADQREVVVLDLQTRVVLTVEVGNSQLVVLHAAAVNTKECRFGVYTF